MTDPRSPHAYRDEATDGEPDTALLVYDSEEETRRSRGGAWLLIAIALVPVAYGLVGIGQSTRLAESVGSASIVVFGVLSLLVFYQWQRRTQERRLRVEFYEDALVREEDGERVRIPWSDVTSVRNRVTSNPSARRIEHEHVVHYGHGGVLSLTGESPALEEVHARLVDGVARHLLPRMLATLLEGETVHARPFSMTLDHLAFGPERRAWADLVDVSLHADVLTLRDSKGVWLERPLEDLDNGIAVAAIAERMIERAAEGPSGP